MNLIPDVILHTAHQDEDQVRDHYDRGDDFYGWFLGPRMIYTSGVISDINKKETLEQLQDNKLTMVCDKLGLKKGDKMLDIGCGWGTLAAFAGKNYGADVTGGEFPSFSWSFLTCQSLFPATRLLSVTSVSATTVFPSLRAASSAPTSVTFPRPRASLTKFRASRWLR